MVVTVINIRPVDPMCRRPLRFNHRPKRRRKEEVEIHITYII